MLPEVWQLPSMEFGFDMTKISRWSAKKEKKKIICYYKKILQHCEGPPGLPNFAEPDALNDLLWAYQYQLIVHNYM